MEKPMAESSSLSLNEKSPWERAIGDIRTGCRSHPRGSQSQGRVWEGYPEVGGGWGGVPPRIPQMPFWTLKMGLGLQGGSQEGRLWVAFPGLGPERGQKVLFWRVLEGFRGLFEGPVRSSRESGIGFKSLTRTHQNVSKSGDFEQFWRLLDRLFKFRSWISYFSETYWNVLDGLLMRLLAFWCRFWVPFWSWEHCFA